MIQRKVIGFKRVVIRDHKQDQGACKNQNFSESSDFFKIFMLIYIPHSPLFSQFKFKFYPLPLCLLCWCLNGHSREEESNPALNWSTRQAVKTTHAWLAPGKSRTASWFLKKIFLEI